MRLKKLQVSGFKSFVDQTDIRLPADLVGVVGPNGCGKSNVIDAVRWVMGESSAKTLRGDNMADVIFNGSSSRKPVGKASVELIFDNSEGGAGGNYAQFAEISVQRTLTRDGQSNYLINRIKSRRKDVLDLFRGTGLGPRSYSIIEQGMVSRIVEARPDDLRLFVEEAAGTSRYKDRRRETENRIRHTRENLDRVEDIRNELDKQLRRLKRQSSSAQRFKVLKEEERRFSGQLHELRLQDLNVQIGNQNRLAAEYENNLQSALAEQRQLESKLEQHRKTYSEKQDVLNNVQQNFYSVGGEIKNAEQRIEHLNETRQRQGEEIERLKNSRKEREVQLQSDRERSSQLGRELQALSPQIEKLEHDRTDTQRRLEDAEAVMRQWQSEWEVFGEEAQAPAQQLEVQKSRIEQLRAHMQRATERRDKLTQELSGCRESLSEIDIDSLRLSVREHDERCEREEASFHGTEQRIDEIRTQLNQQREAVAEARASLHEARSRLQSLEEIQEAALGGENDALHQWLEKHELARSPRLASRIRVIDGWERAADRVMNGFLGAVCVETLGAHVAEAGADINISLISPERVGSSQYDDARPRLSDKVTAEGMHLGSLLGDVFIAESLEQAMTMQSGLRGRQCVVTRDGTLIGSNWISFTSRAQLETGVLVREEEIKKLQSRVSELDVVCANFDRTIEALEGDRQDSESTLQSQRQQLNQLRADRTSKHNRLGREEARTLELEQRQHDIERELEQQAKDIHSDDSQIKEAQGLLSVAAETSGNLQLKRNELIENRERFERRVADARDAQEKAQAVLHEKSLQKQRLVSSEDSLKEGMSRLEQEIENVTGRLSQIDRALNEAEDPVAYLQTSLEEMIERRQLIEKQLVSSREDISSVENDITQTEQQRSRSEDGVNDAREVLDNQKLSRQEIIVRRDTLMEQMRDAGFDSEQIQSDMPEEANVGEWQQQLETLQRKIDRIGPVNLVAIEEFEEESERKEYLDRQHADLTEALQTLESVISKIDRETRSRFRETFDKLNEGFNDFFPQLFGGGKAELQLTSDDLLTTGVAVMARPPGKRNSTIHLLSGGEKALTAVALLFSLFRLNPAPFCMLDEVDAPLDDANVERYCKTLKTLAEVSQMIVITHNKITMEASEILVGVTMQEPGVSRLVSVDLEQAVEMAAQ
ncbi:MAG: chromosome segregation protein SMC [Pseudomonadota bacterium]